MLHRITSIFLLLVFLLGIGGYYPFFKIEQKQIRKAMRRQIEHRMPDRELEVVEEDALNKVSWEREGHEFMFRGKMYDVVRIDSTGARLRYYCINDVKEAALTASLDKLIDEDTDDDKMRHKTSGFLKIFSSQAYLPGTKLCMGPTDNSAATSRHCQQTFQPGFCAEILRPPCA